MSESRALLCVLGGLLLIAAGLVIDARLDFPLELVGDVVAAGGGVLLALGVVLRRR
jgi:hypothetical protein